MKLTALVFVVSVLVFGVADIAKAQSDCNCVKYARTQVQLPSNTDLTYYAAKKNIINHRFPRVGSVAVMPAPGSFAPYGHMSVVRNVVVRSDGGLQLTVDEANWRSSDSEPCVSRRTITPEQRNIDGYFDPAYSSGQSSPRIDSISPATGAAGKQFPITVVGDGFDPNTAQGMILGGWCDSFGKCAVPNGAITNRSSTSLQVPVTLNSPGTYTLYIFNSAAGKTSNGKPITIK